MDQLDHIETEPTTTTTAVPTPILEPTPAPKKRPIGTIIFYILAAIIFLGLVGFATYSVLTTNELNDQVNTQEKTITGLQNDNKKLVTDNKKMNDQLKAAAKANAAASTTPANSDFSALTPTSGATSVDGKTTFTWTAHKDATKYVVEIKSLGQATYPSAYLADQTVTVNTTDPTSTQLSLTKTLASGSYVWRVTAIEAMAGHDMVLQSTTDRNYQVQ